MVEWYGHDIHPVELKGAEDEQDHDVHPVEMAARITELEALVLWMAQRAARNLKESDKND